MPKFEVRNADNEYVVVIARNHVNAIRQIWGKKFDAWLSQPTHLQNYQGDGVYTLVRHLKSGTHIVGTVQCHRIDWW